LSVGVNVELTPITKDNVDEVLGLSVAPGQEEFVATNAWSLAQAFAHSDVAWPRAIVADGTVVGFLMFEIDPDDDDGTSYSLWRMMIDAGSQRKGYGAAALRCAFDEVRALGASEVFTSWVPGESGPAGFYLGLGFQPTGELDEDEIVARLAIDS